MRALREIRHTQKATGFLLLPTPFRRLAREICQDVTPFTTAGITIRWKPAALDALQEGAEWFLLYLFQGMFILCVIVCVLV